MTAKLRRLVSVLTFVLVAAGCSAMPKSGEPHAFDLAAPTTAPVEQLGFGPQQDATPDRIISDFLRACAAGASDDYATAMLYLTESEALKWNPRSGVVVYPTDKEPAISMDKLSSDRAVVKMKTPVSASVADDGALSAHDGTSVDISFTLTKNAEGQWRIEQLDNGIILSEANFQAGFQFVQLYFLSPDQEFLIPDPRWYPRRRLASHLVTGLLAGPSAELAPAVSSALTGSLTMPTRGVEVVDQAVLVRMEGELPTSEQTQLNISRQLSATLLQLTDVTEVEVQINSFPLVSVENPLQEDLNLDSTVGFAEGSIVASDGESWAEILAVSQPKGDVGEPARNAFSSPTIAWVEGDDTVAIWDGADVVRSDVLGATAPSVDRWGWVWTAADKSQLIAVDTQGLQIELELSGAPKGKLQKVAASPDGARLLLLYSSKNGTRAYTATITREATGKPIRLSTPQRAGMAGEGVLDGSWAGYSHLVFLRSVGEEKLVTTAALGGFAQSLGAPSDAIRISGGAQSNQILLGAEEGGYYSRSGGVWRPLETEVEMLSYAG